MIYDPVCVCGHTLRQHRAFRSLSPLVSRDCPVDGCGCKDFQDAEEPQVAA